MISGGSSVGVSEGALGIDGVADGLFDLAGFGEALLLCTREQKYSIQKDIKCARFCGAKSDFLEVLFKGGEEFLGKPSGTQEPTAFGAKLDRHAPRGLGRCRGGCDRRGFHGAYARVSRGCDCRDFRGVDARVSRGCDLRGFHGVLVRARWPQRAP